MAGFLSVANNNVYHSFIAGEDIQNGVFVTPDYETGIASLAGGEDTDIYFVDSENDNAPEYGIDDIDFVNKKGRPLRAHKPSAGEVIVTTNFEEGLVQGDSASVGANGEVVEGGDTFVVKAETTAFGTDAIALQVL